MRIPRILLAALALATAPAAAAEFAASFPIEAGPGAGVQRLELPAGVLAASRSPDLADIRVLDSGGQALPIARFTPPAASMEGSVVLQALPILGRLGQLQVSGVELKLDERGGGRIARIEGALAPNATTVVLGNLFDTRQVRQPAAALVLDASLPVSQPVLLVVESSADLKNWAPLAEQMVYRATAADPVAPIELGGADLKDRYLRLRWRSETALVSPVEIRSATLKTQGAAARAAAPRVKLDLPPQADSHEILFSPPFRAPIAAIDIIPARTGVLVPVTIHGRDTPEQPWMPLGAGTVFRLQEGGQLRQNAPIRLTGSARTLRITADKRTAGFETTPAVELELQPAALLFVASGRPPYRLAVGSDSASPAWLPAETLLPDSGAGTLPPLASIADQPQASLVAPAEDKGIPPRTRILWAILIAGTLILGGMVVWLRKA